MKTDRKLQMVLMGIIMILSFFLFEQSFAQLTEIFLSGGRSEGEFYSQDGVLYVDAIVVKFNDCVIDLPKGQRLVDKNDISLVYSDLHNMLFELDEKYQLAKIVKHVRNAEWGDVYKTHLITGETVRVPDLSQIVSLRFENPVPLEETVRQLEELPVVEYAHQPPIFMFFDSPNDDEYEDQWNLEVVDAEKAWDLTHGLEAIKIAIVDDGVDQNHEDLEDKLGDDGDEVEGDHGTWVAGVAGAETDNIDGVASLGWMITLNTYGGYNIYEDWEYAEDDIYDATDDANHIINMSWGLYKVATMGDLNELCPDCENKGKWVDSWAPWNCPDIEDAIDYATSQGIICVSSAGNASVNSPGYGPDPENCDPSRIPFDAWPSKYSNVIAVSGTMMDGDNEVFNDDWNYGSFVDVSAPGVDIITTDNSGGYVTKNGTSFSAPLVSALAGLILSIKDDLTRTQIQNIIEQTAEDLNSATLPGKDDSLGYGRINAYESLMYTLENYGGTLRGEVVLHEDLTISSGATLTIEAGTTIKFDDYTKLVVNGVLDANGTSANPITFTHVDGEQKWYGIELSGSGATNSSLDYCVIEKVLTYGSAALRILNCSPTIQYCTISSNVNYGTSGIYIYNGDPKLYENTINSNGSDGIYMNDSGGYIYKNTITGNSSYGIYCYNSSGPYFGKVGVYPGENNDISSNQCGVYVSGSSPIIGSSTLSYYKYNSVDGNTSHNCYAKSSSTVLAEYVWWGADPPNTDKITAESGSTIDYSPWATSDPLSKSIYAPIFQVMVYRGEGKYHEAIELCKKIISDNPNSSEAKSAVRELYLIYKEHPDFEISDYCEDIAKVYLGLELSAKEVIWKMKRMQGNYSEALALIDGYRVDTREGRDILGALVDEFYTYYYYQGDGPNAERVLCELQNRFPEDINSRVAEMVINNAVSGPGHEEEQKPAIDDHAVKEIQILQNFPNPGNPITTIRYSMSEESRVHLSIYNILGEKIRTLVSGQSPKGAYETVWDGTDDQGRSVSSGIYIYRIEAIPVTGNQKPFIASRKILLTK